MILRSFSWLAVHELIQAAEASVVPVREGVAKPQARSTGSSVSNSIPNPNGGFPGARFRFRPGKCVSYFIFLLISGYQYDVKPKANLMKS